jgi:nitroimidazol reductase NimA-like FMN-containing flavoprotein (pyridoxamine 5'-phosphate oxidase superfamily)
VSAQSTQSTPRVLTSLRLPELMSQDPAELDALLASTIVAHVAHVGPDGMPGILPTAVARWADGIVVHGSTGSRWMRLVTGQHAAVSITAVDGIVVARSAFESSLLYRSAVVFGRFRSLDGAEKKDAVEALTERLVPGRVAEVRASTTRELAATLVLAMPLTEWSLRISDGWPEDPDEDVAGDAWAGQIRFGERPTTVVEAPDLRPGIAATSSVRTLRPAH